MRMRRNFRSLAMFAVLAAIVAYLAGNIVTGNFGLARRVALEEEIAALEASLSLKGASGCGWRPTWR